MMSLRLKLAAPPHEERTFSVIDESCETDRDGALLSFWAYAGQNEDDRPHFVPYALSHDRSHSHKNLISDMLTVAARTARGYVSGSNAAEAIRKGPKAMGASALRGAGRGVFYGVVIASGRELCRYALRATGVSKPHYYVSPDGPDFLGPIHLK